MLRLFRNGGSLAGDLLVSAMALLLVSAAMLAARLNGWYPEDASSYLLAVALTAASWPASRRFPRTTVFVVGVAVAVPAWVFPVPEVRMLPLIVAAYGAAMRGASPIFVLPVVAVATAAGLLRAPLQEWLLYPEMGAVPFTGLYDPSRHLLVAVVLAGVVALGYAIRSHRLVAEDLRERNAELLALREVERARVAAEVRTEIARDIHDVVAHHVSAMVIRAQAAERVGSNDPRELRTTLLEIADDGSNALTAMRRVVRMMREDGAGREQSAADLDAEFTAILERVRAGGRAVAVTGSTAGGTEFVRAALLRIAQEALTNVSIHSDAANVAIAFSSTGDHVGVTVTDDGSPSPQLDVGRGGNGIRGMAERAHAAGGTMSAGPLPAGGWRVSAVLPATGTPTKEYA